MACAGALVVGACVRGYQASQQRERDWSRFAYRFATAGLLFWRGNFHYWVPIGHIVVSWQSNRCRVGLSADDIPCGYCGHSHCRGGRRLGFNAQPHNRRYSHLLSRGGLGVSGFRRCSSIALVACCGDVCRAIKNGNSLFQRSFRQLNQHDQQSRRVAWDGDYWRGGDRSCASRIFYWLDFRRENLQPRPD